jgi:hypothetical protein
MKLIERHAIIISQRDQNAVFLENFLKNLGFKTTVVSDVATVARLAPPTIIDAIFADSNLICAQKSKVLFHLKTVYPSVAIAVTLGTYSANRQYIDLLKVADTVVDWLPKNAEAIKKSINRLLSTVTGEQYRIHPRTHYKLQINWREDSDDIFRKGEVVNICPGGVFIKQPVVSTKRRSLVLFQLGDSKDPATIVKGAGVVRWICTAGMKTQDVGFGLEFLAVDGDLNRYILNTNAA